MSATLSGTILVARGEAESRQVKCQSNLYIKNSESGHILSRATPVKIYIYIYIKPGK